MNIFDPLTHVLVAAALGGGLDRRDVRAGVRLGEPEAPEDRLVDERREPLALLLLGAGDQDRTGGEAVRGERRADAGAAPAELLADEHPVEARELGAADRRGDVQVEQPDLVGLGDDVGRMGGVLVVRRGARADLVARELPRELAERLLLVVEGEGDARAGSGHAHHCSSSS